MALTPLQKFEKFANAFVSAGNDLIGWPVEVRWDFAANWSGGGSRIELGEKVYLKSIRLNLSPMSTLVVGDRTAIYGQFQIGTRSSIKIGYSTAFNRPSHLSAWEGANIEIGNRCLLSDTTIATSDMHSIIDRSTGARINPARDVIIEDHVWLGEKSSVYKGSRVGTGSIVAGGSLVTSVVPPHCIVAGRPATVIRENIEWRRDLVPISPLPALDHPKHSIVA